MTDEPTHELPDGTKIWTNGDGEYHRDNDLPAYIGGDGLQIWFINGVPLRLDLSKPVVIDTNTQEEYKKFKANFPYYKTDSQLVDGRMKAKFMVYNKNSQEFFGLNKDDSTNKLIMNKHPTYTIKNLKHFGFLSQNMFDMFNSKSNDIPLTE